MADEKFPLKELIDLLQLCNCNGKEKLQFRLKKFSTYRSWDFIRLQLSGDKWGTVRKKLSLFV